MEGSAEVRQLPPGTMLDDKYRIDELLAVGGMGAVYVGTHTKLRKRVAIKVLNPQLASPQMIQRFEREAITASQIGHEGIAQVTDLGKSASGETFLVMELLEGESLAARLKASGPLPIEVACELGCSILSPLGAAHRAGIIHRDLKPDNVFLVRQSRGEMVKLLDFGISRAQGLEQEFRLTTTGLVLGTPYYMSPEQARGEHVITPATDLYSLGVMLYEMLIGAVPITGENYNQLMYRVMTGEYIRPRTLRGEIPEALEQLIVHAMAADPEHRPRTASDFEAGLLPFCRATFRDYTIERNSQQGFAPQLTPAPMSRSEQNMMYAGTAKTQAATPSAMSQPVGAPPKKSRALLIGVIAVAVIGGGITAIIASGGNKDLNVKEAVPAPAPAPAPAPMPAPAPAPVAPTVEKITVKLSLTPKDAVATIDGKPVDGELTVDKDDKSHKLHVEAAGFVAHDEDVKFDESQRLAIQLDRVAAPNVPVKHDPKPPVGKTHGGKIESQSPY
ncbi:MAG: serine/threonine-protein kinase [Kofleriaceae bacterium]